MITLFDIHKRIVEILNTVYANTHIKVITSDKMEDIDEQRPCFKVDIEPILSESVMAGYDINETMILISYFPSVDFSEYSLREKLENMYDELNDIFVVNFLIKPASEDMMTSLDVTNKNYSEDTDGMHMTFSFEVSYHNLTRARENKHQIVGEEVGVNTDPQVTHKDDLDLMQIINLIKENKE